MDSNPQSAQSETPVTQEKRKPSRRFLFVYSFILFFAAFLLILFSYLIQARNNEIALANLQEAHDVVSLSSYSSIANLQERNEQLSKDLELERQESDAKNAELEKLREASLALKTDILEANNKLAENEAKYTELEMREQALSLLLRLQKAYYSQSYRTCGQLIDEMEETGLAQYLPSSENESESPLGLYNNYKKQLRR